MCLHDLIRGGHVLKQAANSQLMLVFVNRFMYVNLVRTNLSGIAHIHRSG